MVTKFEVKGLRDLGAAMKELGDEVAQKIARSMTGAAAGVVKKAAIAKAPQHPKAHTLDGVEIQPGNLKRNIVMKKVKSDLTSEHIVTVRGKRKHGFASRYGALVEFGTVKMPAEPYLRPAFEANLTEAIGAMQKRGKQRIEAAARKARK